MYAVYNISTCFEILPRLAFHIYKSDRGKVTHILAGWLKWNIEFIKVIKSNETTK